MDQGLVEEEEEEEGDPHSRYKSFMTPVTLCDAAPETITLTVLVTWSHGHMVPG